MRHSVQMHDASGGGSRCGDGEPSAPTEGVQGMAVANWAQQ